MNIFQYFESEFARIVAGLIEQSVLPAELDATRVVFELPRDVIGRELSEAGCT